MKIRVLTRLFVAGAAPPFIQSAPPIKLWNSICVTISLWLNTNLYTFLNKLFTLSYIVLNTNSPNRFLDGHLSKFWHASSNVATPTTFFDKTKFIHAPPIAEILERTPMKIM